MATGSYTGKGTYGENTSSKRCGIATDFAPKLLVVSKGDHYWWMVAPYGAKQAATFSGSYNSHTNITWNSNSVTWYSTTNASDQLNDSGATYFYVVLG